MKCKLKSCCILVTISRRHFMLNALANGKHELKSKRIRNPTLTAFAPHFETKMRSWQKLLEVELKVRSSNDRNYHLFKAFSSLTLKGLTIKRGVAGNILDLVPLLNKDKISYSLSSIPTGTPVLLKQILNDEKSNDENFAECEISNDKTKTMSRSIRGIFIGVCDEMIQVKIINEKGVSVRNIEGTKFQIAASNEFTAFNNLLKLLSDRRRWSDYPGYNLLLYAYRARQFPVTFADKPITLPKMFNKEQCAAVCAAINPKRPITAIQGPPGTGKTKVIIEIIAEMVRQKKKVLLCAPSHKAIMNVLIGCKNKGLEQYCKIHGDEYENVKYLPKLIQSHSYYSKLENFYNLLNQSKESNSDREQLLTKANTLERQIQKAIAENTKILFCTITSCSVKKLLELGFEPDLTIIEEAGQAFECETWPMLFQAPRALIVGDHNQIAPMILSDLARAEGLNISLTEWLYKEFGSVLNFSLCVQYRSNSVIQRWSSAEFYNNALKPHHTCADIHLRELFGKMEWNSVKKKSELYDSVIDDPLVLVDTDLYEEELQKFDIKTVKWVQRFLTNKMFCERHITHSAFNTGEAWICGHHIKMLLQPGRLHPSFIGCITPYLSQTYEIAKHLPENVLKHLDISSVDAFQGQEREVIVMSFVRNNRRGTIGFLEDIRRLNVAITRAKRQFFLVASGRMMQTNPAIKRLYEVIQNEGRLIGPLEFILNKQ